MHPTLARCPVFFGYFPLISCMNVGDSWFCALFWQVFLAIAGILVDGLYNFVKIAFISS